MSPNSFGVPITPQAVAIADSLKRALRARGVTYAELARRIKMSEVPVKRVFAKRSFTLARLGDASGYLRWRRRDKATSTSIPAASRP